jgi:hypothetical protein
MRAPFTPSFVFNLSEKPKRSTEVIVASVAAIPARDPAKQDHRIDVISVHVSGDARRSFGQRSGTACS